MSSSENTESSAEAVHHEIIVTYTKKTKPNDSIITQRVMLETEDALAMETAFTCSELNRYKPVRLFALVYLIAAISASATLSMLVSTGLMHSELDNYGNIVWSTSSSTLVDGIIRGVHVILFKFLLMCTEKRNTFFVKVVFVELICGVVAITLFSLDTHMLSEYSQIIMINVVFLNMNEKSSKLLGIWKAVTAIAELLIGAWIALLVKKHLGMDGMRYTINITVILYFLLLPFEFYVWNRVRKLRKEQEKKQTITMPIHKRFKPSSNVSQDIEMHPIKSPYYKYMMDYEPAELVRALVFVDTINGQTVESIKTKLENTGIRITERALNMFIQEIFGEDPVSWF
ncbi:hypothetical protein GCK72_016106 [Caenorhabditis remanei]|uniref:Uncharacterized protein n=1 Tax=Caenorhabditis remanei TaxID=31234 RepID=A0A6A5GYA1_CAERE|nr:hypothetical protein GCK72_016106 [Caenorhabditis remanei]KAF1759639.1 hypothetical protein GCK72_016106 [Caenorhabditis remanei]